MLFIPLHRFDIEDQLDKAINNFLKFDKYFSHDPINEEDRIILLFDGLDELSMQGKMLTEVAQSFLREVERSVANYNSRKLRIQAIISGRDVIIQQNESDFRKDGQILRLLPYFLEEEEREELVDRNHLLDKDQRDDWWIKYGKVKGFSYDGLPEDLKSDEIDEITAQPLLNYLVALSYERGEIDFTIGTNLNEIYHDLLEAVYERSYAEGKRHQSICKMEKAHFNRMLEEIALAAWHGKGRTTTVKEIEKHFEEGGLSRLLNSFIKDAEKGVVSLLAAFYFRQAGQVADGMQTFEFTHKSFGEYLTAKRIINQINLIRKRLAENEASLEDDGWNVKKCLVEWIKIFGNKELDYDLMRFISNEIHLQKDKDSVSLIDMQETIIKLLNHVLHHGMPIENLTPRPETYKMENEFALNAEKALLILHSIIAEVTNKVMDINWPHYSSFGELIGRLQSQGIGYSIFVLRSCNHLKIEGGELFASSLFEVNLNSSILPYSDLSYANLTGADLIETNFSESMLSFSILKGANLKGANLEETDMEEVNLDGANLDGANLQNADLQRANMRYASLREVNLQGANLLGVIFEETDLRGANLEGARLVESELRGANCEGAKYKGKILKKRIS